LFIYCLEEAPIAKEMPMESQEVSELLGSLNVEENINIEKESLVE